MAKKTPPPVTEEQTWDEEQELSEHQQETEEPKFEAAFPGASKSKHISRRNSAISRLDKQSYQRMLQYIRMGAFPHVAAQALGVSNATFWKWFHKGEFHRKGPYRRLYLDVCHASSEARMLAEIEVKKLDPKYWLSKGPGKTKVNDPGWTDEILQVHGFDPDQQSGSRGGQMAPASLEDAAKAFQVLEQIGVVQRTETGRKLFEGSKNEDEDEGLQESDIGGDGSGDEPDMPTSEDDLPPERPSNEAAYSQLPTNLPVDSNVQLPPETQVHYIPTSEIVDSKLDDTPDSSAQASQGGMILDATFKEPDSKESITNPGDPTESDSSSPDQDGSEDMPKGVYDRGPMLAKRAKERKAAEKASGKAGSSAGGKPAKSTKKQSGKTAKAAKKKK